MPFIVKSTRYSLVKGERIVRFVHITRLRDFIREAFPIYNIFN